MNNVCAYRHSFNTTPVQFDNYVFMETGHDAVKTTVLGSDVFVNYFSYIVTFLCG